MNDYNKDDNLKLRTFEKVVDNQRRFRKKLNELIEDERWIRDDGERNTYYEILAWATVGIGDEEYESNWKGETEEVYFSSYQRFFNKAAQISEDYTLIDDHGNAIFADAEKIWKNVKDAFLDKQGKALRDAFRQSPESEQRNPPKTKTY